MWHRAPNLAPTNSVTSGVFLYFFEPQFPYLQDGSRINSYFWRLTKGLLDLNPEYFEIIEWKQNEKMELFLVALRSPKKCLDSDPENLLKALDLSPGQTSFACSFRVLLFSSPRSPRTLRGSAIQHNVSQTYNFKISSSTYKQGKLILIMHFI